jgi:hypothetical protein
MDEYVERYAIGADFFRSRNFAIDRFNRVWFGGCLISGAHKSIQEARKTAFTYAKSDLRAEINGLKHRLRIAEELDSKLSEEFDLRIFKKSS